MKFLLFLAIASTAVAAPKKPAPTPAPEPTISKAEIIATLEHQHELNQQAIYELKKAQGVIVDGLNKRLDGALVEIDSAKSETAKVQHTIDSQRQKIADDEAKIAKYHKLLRIVCTILASVCAFLAYEMLKPLGTIAKLFPVAKFAEFYIPAIVWVAVFSFSWWYF
jgi:hypothetical protein